MRTPSTALRARGAHVLVCFASVVLAASLAAAAQPASDQVALIAPPEGGVDVNAFGHLVTTIETALDRCSHVATPADPTTVDHPTRVMTPARAISLAHGSSYYPMNLMMQGDQAMGMVSFEIDALGNPRFAHVVRALPASPRSEFHKAVRDIVRDSKFAPATVDGQPVVSWKYLKINFLMTEQGPFGNLLSQPRLQVVLAKARQGDLASMAVAQYVDQVDHSEVKLTTEESQDFLVHAALAGFREARGQLVRSLDRPACRQDSDVQEVFHFLTWRGGSAIALNEATRLLALRDPSTYQDVSTLLHGAANAADPFVQLWATGLLATAPVAELRDPAFALQSALSMKNPEQDPDITEALAAAQAANGQFDDAVRTETLALAQAKGRHWNDARLRQRLAAYQSRKPWTEYLCDCGGGLPW